MRGMVRVLRVARIRLGCTFTLVGHDPYADGYNDVVRIVKGVSPEVEMVVAEYSGWDYINAKSVVPPQVEQQAELFKT